MLIKPSKLHYKANYSGFELFYKGQNIGGVNILTQSRRKASNIELHSISAKRERDLLIAGRGSEVFLNQIRTIEGVV